MRSALREQASRDGIDVFVQRSFLAFRAVHDVDDGGDGRRSSSSPPAGRGLGAEAEGETPTATPGTDAAAGQNLGSETPRSYSASQPELSCVVSPPLQQLWHGPPAACFFTGSSAWAPSPDAMAGSCVAIQPVAGWQHLEQGPAPHGWQSASAAAAAALAMPALPLEALPSAGSAGHVIGTCKPCVFFAYGCCLDGADCAHCHVPHEDMKWKRSRPPKFIRVALRSREVAAAPAAGRSVQPRRSPNMQGAARRAPRLS